VFKQTIVFPLALRSGRLLQLFLCLFSNWFQ